MRVVLTLLVRDEADVVEANLVHHLALGVDHVIVTDHRSGDGTTEILERFVAAGRLTLIREQSGELRQSDWVTRMARLAATEHGADWVINGDADELWWPRDGSLKDVLAAVPPRFGALRGLWRNFVPRPEDGRPFHERMTVRRRPASDLTDPFHAQVKVVHRAHPDVVVTQGNHDALGPPLRLRGPAQGAQHVARVHEEVAENGATAPFQLPPIQSDRLVVVREGFVEAPLRRQRVGIVAMRARVRRPLGHGIGPDRRGAAEIVVARDGEPDADGRRARENPPATSLP